MYIGGIWKPDQGLIKLLGFNLKIFIRPQLLFEVKKKNAGKQLKNRSEDVLYIYIF